MTHWIGTWQIGRGAPAPLPGPGNFAADYRRDQRSTPLGVSGSSPVLYFGFDSGVTSFTGGSTGDVPAGGYMIFSTIVIETSAANTRLAVTFDVNGVPNPIPGPVTETSVPAGVFTFTGTQIYEPPASGPFTLDIFLAQPAGPGFLTFRLASVAVVRQF